MNDHKDENAKNPAWQVPVDLPSVKPQDYDVSIDSGRGSAGQQTPGRKQPGPKLDGTTGA